MKLEDFQLRVHLFPCLQINNSNVVFALMQCTEPSERVRLFLHPHSKKEIEKKKMVRKTLGAKNLFCLLGFNIVLWSSGLPRRLWNENGRLSILCAFASVLEDQQ